jgi:hypothetical protein
MAAPVAAAVICEVLDGGARGAAGLEGGNGGGAQARPRRSKLRPRGWWWYVLGAAAALGRRERAERDRVSAWVFPACGVSSPSVAVCWAGSFSSRCGWWRAAASRGGAEGRELNAGTRHGSVLLLGLRQCLLLACVHGGIRRRHLLLPPILIRQDVQHLVYEYDRRLVFRNPTK